ncbi:MAG: hypothetical protein NTU53_23635 [Planctomycetota bacterium]|nr:hypothetical protein [Planctomycetota bacterium]
MKKRLAFALFLAIVSTVAFAATGVHGPLRRHPTNPRYFTDDSGRAVLLTGSHTWNNLVDMGESDPPPRFDYDAYLNWLAAYPHNFFRLWTWELTTWDTAGNREKNAQVHRAFPPPGSAAAPGMPSMASRSST